MGIFSDVKALSDVQKIKDGRTVMLSISQITNLIINLPDAKRHLQSDQFNLVYDLYKQMRKCKTKMPLDQDGYLDTATKIIKEFDKIAPYEKYSGGNEIEFSFMMQDIRKENNSDISVQEEFRNMVDRSGNCDDEYIKYLMEAGFGITYDSAKEFYGILLIYAKYGKEEALRKFDLLVKEWIAEIDENNQMQAISEVPFFCGALLPNGVVTKEESDKLSAKYSEMSTNRMIEVLSKKAEITES
jgi:hypothetical protein